MSLDITPNLRLAVDATTGALALIGLHPYQVWLVNITTTGGVDPGDGGTRTRTDTRITVFDGYNPNGAGDGYKYPFVRYVTGKEIALSNNRLNDKDFCIGPLMYPYDVGSFNQGTSSSIFDPVDGGDQQIYIHMFGTDLDPVNGAYCSTIYTIQDSAISYRVFIRNTGTIIP